MNKKKKKRKKKKKDEPLYVGYVYLRENFSETKFCSIIQVDDVINHAKYFFNRFTRMTLARGQALPFSV